MKTKEKQANKRNCQFSFPARVLICLLLSLFALPITAAGKAKEDFLAENYNLTETYLTLLGTDASYYTSIDTDSQKTASTNVVGVVNAYRKQILDLQSHPDAANRSFEAEVKLAYAKGRVAGRASWIYFYQSPRLKNEESLTKVRLEYENFLVQISTATESTVLEAESDVICAKLNNTIYTYLLRELALTGDSLASSSIIAGSIDGLAAIRDPSLFGDSQEQLYKKTKDALALSRASDQVSAELRTLFGIIRKGESYQSDSTVALFTYKLKNAQTVKAINDAFAETLCDLLALKDDSIYTRIYVATLCSNINEENLKANKAESALSVDHLFVNYTLERAKAEAKDEISALIYAGGRKDEILDAIEAEFNSEGGRIDLVAAEELISTETTRARHMLLCYEDYKNAVSQIEIALKPYEKKEYLALADAIYNDSTNSLRKLGQSPEFEKQCISIESECHKKLTQVTEEAKAERFLLDHAEMISKPMGELGVSDEIYLRHALDDYTKLEPAVAQLLISQINTIAVKYNSVLATVIRSMLDKDALYLDLCELFCEEINNLSRTIIADYYNNCDLILSKAQTLCHTVRYYRELCADDLYASYNASEREDLIDACRDCANSLSALDVNDKGIFTSELSDISAEAKTDLWRISKRVLIRVSARSSSNPEIKAIILEANAKINSSRDKNEISSIADIAIFKINRFLVADAIANTSEKLAHEIELMKFIGVGEKEALISSIKSLANNAKAEALISENLTVLSFTWSSFSSEIAKTDEAAKLKDLSLARESYANTLEEEIKKLLDTIRAMSHLSEAKSEEYFNKISEQRSAFKVKADLADSSNKVSQIYSETLDILYSIEISADSENLAVYKEKVDKSLDTLKGDPKNYSAENYNKIASIIEEAKVELKGAGSISACNTLVERTKERISLVNNLLDDAIDIAIKSIDSKMDLYRSKSNLYSDAALSRLEQICQDAKSKIKAYTSLEYIPAVERESAQALRELSEVKCDYLTSLPDGSTVLQSGATYPADQDFDNGLWGVLYSQNSLPSEAILTIIPSSNSDLRDVQKAIRRAAKSNSIKTFGYTSDQKLLKDLKNAKVALALDITLSDVSFLSQSADLTLLIPDTIAKENILGIAFVDADNNVEFYNVKKENSLISLSLNHFSNYYIVVENTINLMPLIIFLTIMITVEFITLIFILILRFNRKRKENDRMLPMLSSYFAPPLTSFALTQIKPSGAVLTTVLLSVAALALGCAVAALVRLELREYKESKTRSYKPKYNTAEPQKMLLHAATVKSLPQKRAALKAADNTATAEDVYYPDVSSDCAVATEECEVSPEDADLVSLSDDDDAAYTCFGKAHHKAEINLDVIEQRFEDGALVTLDALKRKKLVPKRTDYVKILARGALTKPLIVEANDFSRAAEEMLVALGGEAIRVRH